MTDPILPALLAGDPALAAHLTFSSGERLGTRGEQAASGDYRYALTRDWTPPGERPHLAVVTGLNPSTATASSTDLTTSKLVYYASRDGYTGFVLVNLFALRMTDPKRLPITGSPHGAWNEATLAAVFAAGLPVIAAWGANARHPRLAPEARRVCQMLVAARADVWCFGTVASGHPKHPARLGNHVPLQHWNPAAMLTGTQAPVTP